MDIKEEIRKYPLSKENVELILETRIKEIKFEPLIMDGYITHCPLIERDDFGRYSIRINSSLSEEEQMRTLIHEITHIRYNRTKLPLEKNEERLIETETHRFFGENKDFVQEIYSSLK